MKIGLISTLTPIAWLLCGHEYLTLGAHAQRGLPYLVCVSVCVSVSTYSRPTGTKPAHQ